MRKHSSSSEEEVKPAPKPIPGKLATPQFVPEPVKQQESIKPTPNKLVTQPIAIEPVK
jgi:hypothetical protein